MPAAGIPRNFAYAERARKDALRAVDPSRRASLFGRASRVYDRLGQRQLAVRTRVNARSAAEQLERAGDRARGSVQKARMYREAEQAFRHAQAPDRARYAGQQASRIGGGQKGRLSGKAGSGGGGG